MAAAEPSRAEILKSWALDSGFDRAGVAVVEESGTAPAFRDWLDRGDHAGMEYMARRTDERADPRRLLPGCRSALCVALQYWPRPAERPGGDLWGGVARYARGRDYHDLMSERLQSLAERIREAFPGAATRAYVDTGPVLERELAARAGLGAVGKNTNLLHPEAGSWFLLGEVLLTLALDPDPPIADLCGSCTRCLEACPTGALPEPYRLDSTRCISYWTIEHRGAIPPAMRAELGQWAFGCDVCQEVCPVNETAGPATDPALDLPSARAGLGLAALLDLSRDEYLAAFRGSPMKRARLDGLQRNAAVVMGNRGEERYVAPLSAALAGAEPLVRAHAAWALGRIGGAAATAALEAALPSEEDADVRSEISAALMQAGPPANP